MTPPLKAVLFDLDGTLLDTAPDFASVVNAMLLRHQRQPVPYSAIRQTVSHGARALVELGFGLQPQDEAFPPLLEELLSHYQARLSERTALFDGMAELLQFIESQQVSWGIVTNKPVLYTRAILQDLQLAQRCSTTVCPEHVTHRKPHPEPIQLACAQLGCSTAEALYVGDHRRDIEAGANAGMHTIAAAYGYVTAEDPPQQWGADQVAANVEQLAWFIRQRLAGC
jgi:phosphoglycolate phosphatase